MTDGMIDDLPPSAMIDTRLKVLIADDDALLAELIAMQIEQIGCHVRCVGNGRAALAAIGEGDVDVLVTDWQMPELDGLGLARALRANPPGHYLHIIMMTARGGQQAAALEVEVDAFLAKPVDPTALEITLRSAQRIVQLERRLRRRNRHLAAANVRTREAYRRLKTDLDAAAVTQRHILPTPRLGGAFRHAGLYLPCYDLGGDSYGVIDLGRGKYLFFLVDVCGHGVQAALRSFRIHHQLAAMAPDTPGALSAAAAELNSLALREDDDSYFTMVCGIVETERQCAWLLRAGHPRPLLLDGEQVTALDDGGPPIGLLPSIAWPVSRLPLSAGQRLLIYSDGITECADSTGRRLGQNGLSQLAATHSGMPLDAFVASLEAHLVAGYRGPRGFEDDLSMLALEYLGDGPIL